MACFNTKNEALIIVHLSSLDSYTGQVQDIRDAWDLAAALSDAIRTHRGPVYIVDQDWETGFRDSRPREYVIERIRDREKQGDVTWIDFDEATDDWSEFLKDLKKQLKRNAIGCATLGGVWYNPDLKSGCVTEVYLSLKKYLPVRVDEGLVGCEEEIGG